MALCAAPTQTQAPQQAAASGRRLQVMMMGVLFQCMAVTVALLVACLTFVIEAVSLLQQSSSQEPLVEVAAPEVLEEESALHAAALSVAQSDDGPVTWHANAIASEVTWSLNPLALDMDAVAFFDLGCGDLTDLETMTSFSERPPSPKPRSMRRSMLTISIPERSESSLVLDEHIACEELRPRTPAPLVPLTPSEVNARASPSPRPLQAILLKASEGPRSDQTGRDDTPRDAAPPRRAKASSRPGRSRSKRPAGWRPALVIFTPAPVAGQSRPSAGLRNRRRLSDAAAHPRAYQKQQLWSALSAARATPGTPSPKASDTGSGRDSSRLRAARVLARQAAAAERHVSLQCRYRRAQAS
ncbi:hypothetical protein KFL_003400110 [Klebsormidium nitens]|uniref:Uncharacterized protein n=1 Tax=Klebsormidium nitens TaxID=105231 RepID=A0A1Y1IGH1_KLENI|nr:hypothetical protein KFL_003400110 [Klebsormidium nitens]|eukprot:GAQ87238.1 hypothetical protein KFL_003400110 [Klebsormidium nitens]